MSKPEHPLFKRMVEDLEAAKAVHARVTEMLYLLTSAYEELTDEERADAGKLMLGIENHLGQVKGQLVTAGEGIRRELGMKFARRAIADIDDNEPYRGKYTTANFCMKIIPRLPKAKDETGAYAEVLKYFGVTDPDFIKAGLLTVHYTKLADWLDKRKADGKEVPKQFVASRIPSVRFGNPSKQQRK